MLATACRTLLDLEIADSDLRNAVFNLKDKILGSIWIFKSVPYFDALEIGYHIFDIIDYKKNYATEAVCLITDYLFKTKKLHRLEIRMSVENTASEKVAIKAGYKHERISREAAFSHGRYHNIHSYSLLREEWATKNV